jgi:hypothetical protein
MAVVYRYSAEHRLLYIGYVGNVDNAAFTQAYLDARRIFDAFGALSAIGDFTSANLSQLRASTIMYLATNPTFIPVGGQRCVVTSHTYIYGFTRMFQLATNRDIHIYRTLDEAYKAFAISAPSDYQVIEFDAGGTPRISTAPR